MFTVYPLFVQVDYTVLADSKSTWSQDKHFFKKNILMNDLSTVQFLIHNDPPLLLKLVELKRLLYFFLHNETSIPAHQLFQT